MHIRHFFTIILCAILFSSCSFTKEQPTQTVKNAKNATIFAEYILQIFRASPTPGQPAANLGVHVGRYIGQYPQSRTHGALQAIDLLVTFFPVATTTNEDIAILQALGNQLQIDVIDMLNRSTNRADALNQYTERLQSVAEEANNAYIRLRSQEEDLSLQIRAEQRQIGQLQRDNTKLLNAQDFSAAGTIQEELARLRTDLARTQVLQEQLEDLADTLEDLLSVAAERLEAINQNREALIAGIKITELPGTKALGIVEKGNGKTNGFGKPKSGFLDFSDL